MNILKIAPVILSSIITAGANAEDLTLEQSLGKLLYQDVDLSVERNQSCESCHSTTPLTIDTPAGETEHPAAGFAHPKNVIEGTVVAEGSLSGALGSVHVPSIGYSAFTPEFHWDGIRRLWIGGQFWDGRAATLAAQAGHPFLNPNELAMPSKWAVVSRIKEKPKYGKMFLRAYGINLDQIPSQEMASADRQAPPGVLAAYSAAENAISKFEKSRVFNKFNSKYDYVVAGVTEFSALEAEGHAIFNGGKAMCFLCHTSESTTSPDNTEFPAIFTNFAYENLGLPANDEIPGGESHPGLGGRYEVAIRDTDGSELGKHKIPTLRNVALTPPYMHNGSLKTLEQVVHFYNTRDTKPRVCDSVADSGFSIDCWPAAEFPGTMNEVHVGNLGLTEHEESALVAFLATLTDNYPVWGNQGGNSDPAVPEGTASPFMTTNFPFDID